MPVDVADTPTGMEPAEMLCSSEEHSLLCLVLQSKNMANGTWHMACINHV